jgi:RNA-splicing ligase RtcB
MTPRKQADDVPAAQIGNAAVHSLSSEPLGKLYSWIPRGLQAERIVFLPDACPGKSPLPTGTAVLSFQPDWRRFAISDCGCGMSLIETQMTVEDLTRGRWNRLADALRARKGRLGDLGGGNHFLDAMVPYVGENVFFLVHTGSRSESGLVDELVDQPDAFDREFNRIVAWAADNRSAIHDEIRKLFGPTQLILDLPHNTYELVPGDGAIIRKGAVRVRPGDPTILPSHMAGDVALVRATEAVADTLYSFSHGTGRTMPRSGSRAAAEDYDFADLRKHILMPDGLADASLRTEGPYAYRDLDACLALSEGYVDVINRYEIVAYMGHLG